MPTSLVQQPPVAQMSDGELLPLVAQHRVDAFEELYQRHAGAIVSIVRQFTADRISANEATQSAFLALWQRAGTLEPNSRLRSWLATVARNSAISQHRRKRLETVPLSPSNEVVWEQPGPEEHAIMSERRRDIREALNILPREQRQAIELAYFGGMSQSEIAELVGEPLGTIKSRIRLAMQRLRALMAGKEDGNEPTFDAAT